MGRKPIGKKAMTAAERQWRRRERLRNRDPEQEEQDQLGSAFGSTLAEFLKNAARRHPLLQAKTAAKELRRWSADTLDHYFRQMRLRRRKQQVPRRQRRPPRASGGSIAWRISYDG